ncbi:DUF397 domain-containing protein [Actinomadura alba]|uniref:DUF397 domain-containing protein n=1 Tax=Actinomadura alba TaxID=406431 RepID=A0ABR7LKB6_9ACTN|nr:DUF397 domain-containing protein [Actinomadura alba]MBC6464950.1 DUF397 domain-containing protein [Actinomadura alba]
MSELDLPAMHWRKSSHSGQGGEDCVEVAAAQWRKSNRSSGQGGQCVEVAGLPGAIAVRDSKNPDGPKLAFTATEWATFVTAIKSNDHA